MKRVMWQICNTQGDIFEHYASLMSSAEFNKFVKFYLESDFCAQEMDASYSWLHLQPALQSADFIDMEIKKKHFVFQKEKKTYNLDVAWWLGFTYRHLALKTKMKSKDLMQKVKMNSLVAAYPGLSTLDDDMAAEIICEEFRLPVATKNV